MNKTPIYSLSLNARATLDLHSLNNEGGEGNQIQTRMVNIVDQRGEMHNVNAISGDMYKHVHAEHLFRLATQRDDLPLCAGCREFNANRINADPDFQAMLGATTAQKNGKGKAKQVPKHSDAEVIDYLLKKCVVDDVEGILITSAGKPGETQEDTNDQEDADSGRTKKRSIPRKSIVEFGWVVGVPGYTTTDSYFHVKYSSSDRAKSQESRDEEETRGSNLGQAIFHRPASSGIYAAVCHVELARIGFNDITQRYAIDETGRSRRARAVLEALLYTFLEPRGAMRSAQTPHLVNLEGVLTVSAAPVPAPTVSPLHDGYVEQIDGTVRMLNRINGDVVAMFPFGTPADLSNVIADLLDTTSPYALRYVEA